MMPDASHTPRGSLSPRGTLRGSGAAQLEQNFIQALDDAVGLEAEALERGARAVDPEDGEAERLGAERIPAVGRHETDWLLRHAELLRRELVDLRRGLEDLQLVHADDGVELEARVRDQGLEHVGRAVGENRFFHPTQRSQGLWYLRVRREHGV